MSSMNSFLFQNITERAYLEAVNFEEAVANDSEEETLYTRLDRDDRAYTLHNSQRLDISSLDDDLCKKLFRFTCEEIKRIVRAMGFPESIQFRENSAHSFSWDAVDALAIMLRRFAYPSRLLDLSLLFGIHESTICTIFNSMVEKIYLKYKDGIRYNKKHLTSLNLRIFNDAIVSKGSCYEDVVGFIDGTLNAICRPGEYQESVYNGHVRQHGLKYQAIVCPDGITVSLCGPFAGAIHDQNMLDSSDILNEMKEQLDCRETDGKIYALYGDPAYRESSLIIRPLLTARTTEERRMNLIMSRVRECVEWEFGHVASLFAFLKFRQGQKLLLSRVGLFYVVATFLKNVHICINRGNQTSMYFGLRAPLLEQYIEEITPE